MVAPGGGDTEPASAVEPKRSILSLFSATATGLDSLGTECHTPEGTGDLMCEPAPWVIDREYVRASGTSFAAPHVAGVAALVRSRHPEFTQQQVRQVLRNTADDLGPVGWDEHFGYGRVDARRAVHLDDIPVAEILAPENRSKVWERTFPLSVLGTIQPSADGLAQWRLTVRPLAGGEAAQVASGTSPVVDGTLGTLNLRGCLGLQAGQRYVVDLEATDTAGHVARDSKTFLIPNPQFAAIPVPDPHDEGAFAPALSGDGRWLAVTRSDRDPPNDTTIWLLDAQTAALSRIPRAGFPQLSATGGFLLYGAEGMQLRDLVSDSTVPLPFGELQLRTVDYSSFRIVAGGARVVFVSNGDLDPAVGNADGSAEVFELDRTTSTIRQLTNGPLPTYPFGLEVQDLAITPDGARLAFSANNDLDPTATTGGVRQIFVYDNQTGTTRQLTGLSAGTPSGGGAPTLTADGGLVTFASGALFLGDTRSGSVRQVLDETGYPAAPLLSADGSKLAFAAAVDVDPSIANEDLSPEIFLLDLLTGNVAQVTDTVNFLVVPYDTKMDATAATFLLATSGELNGYGIQPSATRWVRSRPNNRRPVLTAPQTIVARELETSKTMLYATDPDGDAVVFYAQRVPAYQTGRLRDLAASELRDHGDGTAELLLTPRFDEAGTYPLRIAAFDEGGDLQVQDVTLIIEDTYLEGDANCDGRITDVDIAALVRALFEPDVPSACVTADANDDHRISVADLVGLLHKLP